MDMKALKDINSIYEEHYNSIRKNSFEVRLSIQSKISRILEKIRYREAWLINEVEAAAETSRRQIYERLSVLRDFYSCPDASLMQIEEQLKNLTFELPTKEELYFQFIEDDFKYISQLIQKAGQIKYIQQDQDTIKYLNEDNLIIKDDCITENFAYERTEPRLINPLIEFVNALNQTPTSYWLQEVSKSDWPQEKALNSDWFRKMPISYWLRDDEDKMEDNDLSEKTAKKSATMQDISLWLNCDERGSNEDVELMMKICDDDDDDFETMDVNCDDNLRWIASRDNEGFFTDQTSILRKSKLDGIKQYFHHASLADFIYKEENPELLRENPIDVVKNVMKLPWQIFLSQ